MSTPNAKCTVLQKNHSEPAKFALFDNSLDTTKVKPSNKHLEVSKT